MEGTAGAGVQAGLVHEMAGVAVTGQCCVVFILFYCLGSLVAACGI